MNHPRIKNRKERPGSARLAVFVIGREHSSRLLPVYVSVFALLTKAEGFNANKGYFQRELEAEEGKHCGKLKPYICTLHQSHQLCERVHICSFLSCVPTHFQSDAHVTC